VATRTVQAGGHLQETRNYFCSSRCQ